MFITWVCIYLTIWNKMNQDYWIFNYQLQWLSFRLRFNLSGCCHFMLEVLFVTFCFFIPNWFSVLIECAVKWLRMTEDVDWGGAGGLMIWFIWLKNYFRYRRTKFYFFIFACSFINTQSFTEHNQTSTYLKSSRHEVFHLFFVLETGVHNYKIDSSMSARTSLLSTTRQYFFFIILLDFSTEHEVLQLLYDH